MEAVEADFAVLCSKVTSFKSPYKNCCLDVEPVETGTGTLPQDVLTTAEDFTASLILSVQITLR